jgi:hypothetical protein
MKIKYYLTIFLFLNSYLHSQYSFEIKNNNFKIDIDIKKDIEKDVNQLIEKHECGTIVLNFENYNEKEIDSLVELIKYKEKITKIDFSNCKIEYLPYSINKFRLTALCFVECDKIKYIDPKIITKGFELDLFFLSCKIDSLPNGIEKIKRFLKLYLTLPKNSNFNFNKQLERFIKKNNIKILCINDPDLYLFPENLFKLTSIQILDLSSTNITKIDNLDDNLPNLIGFFWPAGYKFDK